MACFHFWKCTFPSNKVFHFYCKNNNNDNKKLICSLQTPLLPLPYSPRDFVPYSQIQMHMCMCTHTQNSPDENSPFPTRPSPSLIKFSPILTLLPAWAVITGNIQSLLCARGLFSEKSWEVPPSLPKLILLNQLRPSKICLPSVTSISNLLKTSFSINI